MRLLLQVLQLWLVLLLLGMLMLSLLCLKRCNDHNARQLFQFGYASR